MPLSAQYGYDANGNMITDPYKNLSVTYNFLNLPTTMTFDIPATGAQQTIDILYDGSGRKLRKTVKDAGVLQYTQDYVGGIEYRTSSTVSLSLESIAHGEGRVFNTNTGTTSADVLRYEYAIKDHLGNTRLTFTDKNADGKIDITTTSTNEVLQENHYYPFGLAMNGPWINDAAIDNKYQYNGKEINDDFGLGWNDYGARWYDASVGRWWSVDLMAEKTSFNNPYHYVSNNPIIRVDPTGMFGVTYGAAGYSSTSSYFEGSQQKQDELQQDKPKAVVNILSLPGANQTVVKKGKERFGWLLKLARIDVKTKVVTQTSKFDIKKIKPRDAVVGGSNAEAADYILNKIDRGYYSKTYKDQLERDGFRDKDKYNNIEKSDKGDTGWGYLIATSTDIQLDIWKFKSQSNAVAFSILHGMGHNAGFSHFNKNDPERGFMNGGGTLMGAISISTPEQMIKGTPMIVINQIQQRFHY